MHSPIDSINRAQREAGSSHDRPRLDVHDGVLCSSMALRPCACCSPPRIHAAIALRSRSAQAVYGSIAARSTIRPAPPCPASPSPSPASSARPSTPSSPTSRASTSRSDCCPAPTRSKAELAGFKPRSFPDIKVSVDTQTTLDFELEVGDITEAVTVTADSPAAQDRPRRRRDDLRHETDHRPAGARPQLHQVHPADARARSSSSGSTRPARTRRARPRRW